MPVESGLRSQEVEVMIVKLRKMFEYGTIEQ